MLSDATAQLLLEAGAGCHLHNWPQQQQPRGSRQQELLQRQQEHPEWWREGCRGPGGRWGRCGWSPSRHLCRAGGRCGGRAAAAAPPPLHTPPGRQCSSAPWLLQTCRRLQGRLQGVKSSLCVAKCLLQPRNWKGFADKPLRARLILMCHSQCTLTIQSHQPCMLARVHVILHFLPDRQPLNAHQTHCVKKHPATSKRKATHAQAARASPIRLPPAQCPPHPLQSIAQAAPPSSTPSTPIPSTAAGAIPSRPPSATTCPCPPAGLLTLSR
jgi:hypothetical protein